MNQQDHPTWIYRKPPYFEGPFFFFKALSSSRSVSVSTTHFDREKAEKKRSKLADDGDLSELFDALELEDDGKAVGPTRRGVWMTNFEQWKQNLVGWGKKGGWKTPQFF